MREPTLLNFAGHLKRLKIPAHPQVMTTPPPPPFPSLYVWLTNKVSTVDGLFDADAGEDEGGDDDDEPEEPGFHFIKFFSPILSLYTT
jgi:hypothetical protein